MLRVSAAVSSGGRLANALDQIAEQACLIASAQAAAILELTGEERFRIVGSYGLSDEYRRTLHAWPTQLAPGQGPSGLAVAEGKPVMSNDFSNDKRFRQWAEIPLRQAWEAVVAFPLIVNNRTLGTLVLYRTDPQPWDEDELRLLEFVAEHAGIAVRTAQLIDEQQRQVGALERMVRSLREQAHEHSNRLHALAGLLALGEPEEALAFVQELTEAHVGDVAGLDVAWPHSVVTSLLRVEMLLARHRSIELSVELPSVLPRAGLTDAQAVTILGNLLDNAFDAVAEAPDDRRRVVVGIAHDGRSIIIRVRDWGVGIARDVDPFEPGLSTKDGHSGVGLALVRSAVVAAHGDVYCEHHRQGTSFVVSVPLVEAADVPDHDGIPRAAAGDRR